MLKIFIIILMVVFSKFLEQWERENSRGFGIQLPPDFDMPKYEKLNRADRLDYVNEKVPLETVINYQNEIGKSMCPMFNISGKTISVPGFAGKDKIGTDLTIELRPKGQNRLSIIREDGTHISTFSVDDDGIKKLIKNGFWVLRNRNL